MNMFKEASKLKLRFNTVRGLVSIEDLWEMPLISKNNFNLNEVAKSIYLELKQDIEIDFVGAISTENKLESLKLDIVKEIIKDKKEELQAKEQSMINKAHNENIDKLIADKKAEKMRDMTIEELEALRK